MPRSVRFWLPFMSSLLVLPAGGCGSTEKALRSDAPLPFVVRVLPVRLPVARVEDGGPVTPLVVDDHGESFTRSLAAALERADIFTGIVTDAADSSDADLELSVEVRGRDFGDGEILAGGATLSTFTWLFAGPLAWFVTDRAYPESTLVMDVSIRAPDGSSDADSTRPAAVFEDRLLLKGLELDFLDRASTSGILLTIIVPPWVHGGDPEAAGATLAQKSIELFAGREPDQVVTRFPALYFQRFASYLVRDAERREVVILSSRGIEQVSIVPESGRERVLNPDETARCEVVEPRAKEEVWQRVAGRAVGIGSESRCYRIRLGGGEKEPELLRIEAVLDGGLRAGPWTIRSRP
jgi:hypothetical protein